MRCVKEVDAALEEIWESRGDVRVLPPMPPEKALDDVAAELGAIGAQEVGLLERHL